MVASGGRERVLLLLPSTRIALGECPAPMNGNASKASGGIAPVSASLCCARTELLGTLGRQLGFYDGLWKMGGIV